MPMRVFPCNLRRGQNGWKSQMSQIAYRAYFLDERDHIERAVVINALNDQQATAEAMTLVGVHTVELWDGSRLIVRLPRSE